MPKSGDGVAARAPPANRRQRAEDGRLQRDMMDEVGYDRAVNAPQRQDGRDRCGGRKPSAPEAHWMENKALARDGRRAVRHIGRDMYLEARGLRGPRHRQAMRQEEPVLRDDVEQARRTAVRARWQAHEPLAVMITLQCSRCASMAAHSSAMWAPHSPSLATLSKPFQR